MPYHPNQYLLNDCSSNFLTKPIDWTKTTMSYAHTQKNCGISGSTIMIVNNDILLTKK
jgi:phosphoserine aminotransferase